MAAVESDHRPSGASPLVVVLTETEGFLELLQRFNAFVIGFIFLLAALICSLRSSKTEEDAIAPTVKGPGGKPLPVTKRKRSSNQRYRSNRQTLPHIGRVAKRIFQLLSSVLTLTFALNAIAIGTHALEANQNLPVGEIAWWCGEPMVVYVVGSACVYLYFTVTLFDWEDSPGLPHFLTWCVALVAESMMFLCSFLRAEKCKVLRIDNGGNFAGRCLGGWEQIDMALSLTRVATLFGLCCIFACMWTKSCHFERSEEGESSKYTSRHPLQRTDSSETTSTIAEEDTPLLTANGRSYNTQINGTHERGRLNTDLSDREESPNGLYQEEQAAFYRPEKLPKRNWWEYLRGYALFWPYLWPRDSFWLKFRVLVCFVLLILQRGVNILLPFMIGQLTDRLAKDYRDGAGMGSVIEGMPWVILWIVNGLMLLQGQAGLLGSIRSIIWIKVSQYSYKALETAAFQHVHSLSLDFHLSKRTGEVLSALNKGGAINTFLEQVTFQLFPMILDLFLAIYFFNRVFDSTYGVIVSVNTFWYLYLTIKMAQTRADQRREMTNADREEEAVKNDSITSYETVKYFNAERAEFRRYENAIDQFQRAEAKVSYGTNMMSIVQVVVFVTGLAVAITLGAFQVWNGFRTVGDFVVLMTYLQQLQGPLNFFSQFYRVIQQALISGERLLELFKIQPSVQDLPNAKELTHCEGHIQWRGVKFSYGNQPALNDLEFECKPGTTTAFVGESGGGKSTVFRLMFRYYNCSEGTIAIDGHDVKDLTIDSVRRFIGVVPQDTILFNETLMYNLKYARPGCTDEEVYEACKAASIHDKIMAFPQQYDTKVGERGLRLSGGEKQRVAIARTILKNPKIIMLDEATSALDSRTEQHIQKGFQNVGEGRTVLIIAHRLSTITHADQIIVLNQGKIVEKGTHEELINYGGYYTSMWEKQAHDTRAANRACYKLLKQANMSGRSPFELPSGYTSMASSGILPGPSPMQESKPVSPTDSCYDHSSSSDGDSSHTTLQNDSDRP